MYTEEEAKGKQCLHRATNTLLAAISIVLAAAPTKATAEELNKSMDVVTNPVHNACIASECMAWRWNDENKKYDDDGMEVGTGYCGLAGKP